MKMKTLAALFAVSLTMAANAFSQEQTGSEAIVLHSSSGKAVLSDGNEFITTKSGQQVSPGQRFMVMEGTSARIVYDRGTANTKDDCVMEYKQVGVFDVPGECQMGAGKTASSNTNAVLTIVGSAALGAAILNSQGDKPPPPISSGVR